MRGELESDFLVGSPFGVLNLLPGNQLFPPPPFFQPAKDSVPGYGTLLWSFPPPLPAQWISLSDSFFLFRDVPLVIFILPASCGEKGDLSLLKTSFQLATDMVRRDLLEPFFFVMHTTDTRV